MIDKDFWSGATVCLLFLAVYCHGSVLVASILSYPALRGLPQILGGVTDDRMPKTREGRVTVAITFAALSAAVISFLPIAGLLTIGRSGNNSAHLLIALQVVLALVWTAWLVRLTRRRMRSLP